LGSFSLRGLCHSAKFTHSPPSSPFSAFAQPWLGRDFEIYRTRLMSRLDLTKRCGGSSKATYFHEMLEHTSACPAKTRHPYSTSHGSPVGPENSDSSLVSLDVVTLAYAPWHLARRSGYALPASGAPPRHPVGQQPFGFNLDAIPGLCAYRVVMSQLQYRHTHGVSFGANLLRHTNNQGGDEPEAGVFGTTAKSKKATKPPAHALCSCPIKLPC